ncbi:MAG: hypothetical protein GX591_14575 [Planctomycetes bacterium]|nr:hypothetical protein [Planctomycetota bacterium]
MTETIRHHYDLTPDEAAEVRTIQDALAQRGRLYRTDRDGRPVMDAAGLPVPVDFLVLRSRRFLVDADGTVWRFFGEGSDKHPDSPDRGGAPWRSNRVEMWTGRWRAVRGGDGQTTWAKVLVARPVDKRINGHPGMPQIAWYRTVKGYRHPHEGPDQPPSDPIERLGGPRPAPQAQAQPQQQLRQTQTQSQGRGKDNAHVPGQKHGQPRNG